MASYMTSAVWLAVGLHRLHGLLHERDRRCRCESRQRFPPCPSLEPHHLLPSLPTAARLAEGLRRFLHLLHDRGRRYRYETRC